MTYYLKKLLHGPVSEAELRAGFSEAATLEVTPQDEIYHAEGNVWIHTMMVMGEIEKQEPSHRSGMKRLAALLHDISKPETTIHEFCEKEQRMRVRQPGHAAKGRDKAWRLLTDAGFDPVLKSSICEIIAWHQRPGHLLEQKNLENRILRYAALGENWSDLLDLCRADNLGRICPGIPEHLLELDLIESEVARLSDLLGMDLLHGAPQFSGARIRYLYADYANSIHHEPWPKQGAAELHIFSGLPGAGKSHFRREIDARIISMDDLRRRIKGFRHGNEVDQGRVAQEAIKQLKQALAAGENVIWDATCVTRLQRAKIVSLGEAYGARCRIWSFEDPADICSARNAARDGAAAIPQAAFDRMAASREAVTREEAEEISRVIDPTCAANPGLQSGEG